MNEETLKRNNKKNKEVKRQGLFITFEGPEGAGKSTHCAMLSEWMALMGVPVLTTREPGEGVVGGQIRRLILNPENTTITPKTEALLYAADRAQHVDEVLRPALDRGKVVVCDRYADSYLAYQGYGRGLDLTFLRQLNQMATGGLQPDLTILLDLDSEEGLARVRARESSGDTARHTDRMEREELAFHRRLRDGYRQLAAETGRIKILDAGRGINEVKYEIRRLVSGLLLLRGFIDETNLDNEFFAR